MAEEELGREGLSLAPDALDALARHAWPGNVRELRNAILRAAATAPVAELRAEHLTLEEPAPAPPAPPAGDAAGVTLREARQETERARLLEALDACGWNFAHAAKRLGISRMTLYRLARRNGVERATRTE
ncbi:MAG: helix-turn-helix domain-containing protein [Anaeromyxobacter sp.]